MANYAISTEGVAALRQLSGRLQQAQANIEAAAGALWAFVEREEQLGGYEAEITELLDKNRQFLSRIREDILVLARCAEAMADKIEAYMRQGILGGTGGGASANTGAVSAWAGTASADAGAVRGKREAPASQLRPDRSCPRDLPVTQFGYREDGEGNLVYDTPEEMDVYLYKTQGKGRVLFKGTCGLCSCANIMRLAGVNATEREMIDYASKTPAPNAKGMLCGAGYVNPANNGGTNAWDRKEILSHFGVESSVIRVETDNTGMPTDKNIEYIASYVEAGRGVILSVHSDMLWYDKPYGKKDYHAVTVTSVKRDKEGGILGFYICDSQKGDTSFYQAGKVKNVLTGSPMNVTQSIIR